ncbi:MAG: hypothetical protein NDI84_13355, partial [Steroidobacteraceae bacterium]|nr:hypothetical protein [Steroidobacteraceae bacterium]
GYTGHEMLDNVALIHMNGRVLDPVLGRFLSADPYIDGPLSTQGWNRYAYVHGRVMSATDPSGYGMCPPNAACLCYAYDNCNVLWTSDEEIVVLGKRSRGWTDPFLVTVDRIDDIIGLPNSDISSGDDSSIDDIVDIVCDEQSSSEHTTERISATAANAGDVADTAVPAAAFASDINRRWPGNSPAIANPWPEATSFLSDRTAGTLRLVGKVGQFGSAALFTVDLVSGRWLSAAHLAVDTLVYTGLGAVAMTGLTTGGFSTGGAVTAAALYYAGGGSEGVVAAACSERRRKK